MGIMDFAYVFYVTAILLQGCLGQSPTAGGLPFEIRISPDQAEQLFSVGDDRILTCSGSQTSDGEWPALHWQFNGVRIVPNSKLKVDDSEERSILRITNVGDADGGTYTCVGSLNGQEDSRTVKVEVYIALEVHSNPEQFGIYGKDGEVLCNATGKPAPSITWKFKNETRIRNNDKYTIQPNKLIIKNLDFNDKREYLCDVIVINTGKSRSFYINYEVVQIPTIALPPTIQPNNPKVGDDVTMTCEAQGVPKPTYQYRRNGNLLPDNDVDEINGILTIKNLKREDEATYTCVATNKGGKAEKSNTLDVKIPPIIKPIINVTDAVEGSRVSVTCTAEGDPAPTVSWKKQGEQDYADGTRDIGPEIISEQGDNRKEAEIKIVGKTMKFDSVEPQDAGFYVCTAFNTVGNVSSVVKFDVKYKPHFNTNFKDTVFYGWSGHRANLTCQASANELATFKWYRPDQAAPQDISKAQRIENQGPFTLMTLQQFPEQNLVSSSLIVNMAVDEESRYGDYLCEASNTMGDGINTVTLKKATPPGQPVVRVSSTLSTMVSLDVDIPKQNGGQPVTAYKYEFFPANSPTKTQEGSVTKTGDTTRVELRNLDPATSYVVKVYARNVVGVGTAMPITFDTKKVSKPLKLTFVSPQEGNEPTTYRVQWADPDDGGATIDKYVIKYKKVEVTGSTPNQWVVSSDIDKDFTVKMVEGDTARSFTLQSLLKDSYYEIRITAINKEGESDEEFRIIKTSKGGGSSSAGSAGLGSGPVIGIIVGLLIIVLIIVAVIYFVSKKKPELVGRITKGRLGAKGGEEEGGAKDDGKDPAEEEKLLKKEDTVKLENETGDGKMEKIEDKPEEFEPDNKPAPQPDATKDGAGDKPEEGSMPAPTTEINIIPETPEKPENPAA